MKNYIYGAIALTAILASGCAKEVSEVPVIDNSIGGTPIRISATLDDSFKTAYANEKTFSWVDGDKAALVVIKDEDNTKDVITLTATNSSGASTELVGVLPDGYTASDYVWYPYESDAGAFYSSGLGKIADGENMNIRMWCSITPDLDNPMASIPLIGKRRTDVGDALNFSFRTATGVLRLEVANIPEDAYFLQFNAPSGTALNGNYALPEDCTIKMADVVGTPWPEKYVMFTPQAANESRVFYIPIPVGTIPSGTVISITSTDKGNMPLVTTTEDIEVEANNLYRLPRLVYPSDEWVSMGTGKFKDTVIWSKIGVTDYVEVEFFENPFYPGVYRFANPYTATGKATGEGLPEYFEINVNGREVELSEETYNLGLEVKNTNNSIEYTWTAVLYDNPYGSVNQSVLKFQSNGLPAVVQLAPCYRDSEGRFDSITDDTQYGYEFGNDHNCLGVEINFPGQPGYATPTGTVEDVIGEFYIISSDYWGSYQNTATTLVISASDDTEKGNVMITTFQNVSAATNDTFNPLYGTYEDGVLSFGITQEKDGMFVDANGSTHRFRNYFDKDLAFSVPRKGVLTIGYFQAYIGNRWDKDGGGSFDQLWIQYDAFAQ